MRVSGEESGREMENIIEQMQFGKESIKIVFLCISIRLICREAVITARITIDEMAIRTDSN